MIIEPTSSVFILRRDRDRDRERGWLAPLRAQYRGGGSRVDLMPDAAHAAELPSPNGHRRAARPEAAPAAPAACDQFAPGQVVR